MTIGEKLQMLRKAKGISQEQLAAEISVSRQAVSKWELDESVPDTEKVIMLAKFYGVSLDYLLLDKEEKEPEKSTALKNDNVDSVVTKGGCIGSLGLLIIGFLVLAVGGAYWQTIIPVGIGIGLQIIAIVFFEMVISLCKNKGEALSYRKKFYTAVCWLVSPALIAGMTAVITAPVFVLHIIEFPYPFNTMILPAAVFAVLYLAFNIVATLLIKRKK